MTNRIINDTIGFVKHRDWTTRFRLIAAAIFAFVGFYFLSQTTYSFAKTAPVNHTYRINANCTEGVRYNNDNTSGGDPIHIKSCIYLINNKSWIKAVVSWDKLPCEDYSSKFNQDDEIEFSVRDDSIKQNNGHIGLTIHNDFVHTCYNSAVKYNWQGSITWESPVINGHSYHTYALFQPSYYSSDYARELHRINSPSLTGYTSANRNRK